MRKLIMMAALLAASLILTLGGTARASSPVPFPAALDNGRVLGLNLTGADMNNSAWKNNPNDPGNCAADRTAGITTSGSKVVLTSNGSDCLYLESPHPYPTAVHYVYEEQVTVSSWTPWLAFWAYGDPWPTAGEVDAIEASPTGQNNISYHNSTGSPTGYSTCNNADGCDGNALPITSPSGAQAAAQGLSVGTHIIDYAFSTCGSGCGVVSVWYDGREVAHLSGSGILNGGSQRDPFWIVDSNGKPETGSCGNPCGSLTVDYLRGWS
jgi:hypothetical protein